MRKSVCSSPCNATVCPYNNIPPGCTAESDADHRGQRPQADDSARFRGPSLREDHAPPQVLQAVLAARSGALTSAPRTAPAGRNQRPAPGARASPGRRPGHDPRVTRLICFAQA